MQIKNEILDLISQLGSSKMSSAAYDTAWVAQTVKFNEPMGEQALNWLRENQLPGGCWGSEHIPYSHDRVVCTLASMIALQEWGNEKDQHRVELARLGLDTAINGLRSDVAGATVGFEMIVPLLLETAYEVGALQRKDDKELLIPYSTKQYDDANPANKRQKSVSFDQLKQGKKQKLAALPDGLINRHVTISFSAEMVGPDGINLLDVDNLLEIDGSVGGSPSATAFYALHVCPGDPTALAYLRNIAKNNDLENGGGIPEVAPFDTYEIGWALWNLSLIDDNNHFKGALKPHLDFLLQDWKKGKGISFAKDYSLVDGDNTSVIFETLHRFGTPVDLEALLSYERDDHFCCYDPESTPSLGVNVHVLSALREAGLDAQHPSVKKVVKFINSKIISHTFWADKWHASPYYATAHTIIAAAGFVDDLVTNAVDWIIETQKESGAWGYYIPTAEETAYCLQALLLWQRNGGEVPTDTIARGLDWLTEHRQPPYEPQWICKCLYTPELIVRSAVLSALTLGAQAK